MRGTMLIAMLALGPAAGLASAQDTVKAQQDTLAQDTSQVQNPPGYRGMERDTTVFPPQDDTTAQAGDETTRIEQMKRQDTLQNQDQNPPGYRGMERDTTTFPLEKDTARDTADTGAAADTAKADTTKADTTKADTIKADTAAQER